MVWGWVFSMGFECLWGHREPPGTAHAQLRLPSNLPHTRLAETAPGLITPQGARAGAGARCPPRAPGVGPPPGLDVNPELPDRHQGWPCLQAPGAALGCSDWTGAGCLGAPGAALGLSDQTGAGRARGSWSGTGGPRWEKVLAMPRDPQSCIGTLGPALGLAVCGAAGPAPGLAVPWGSWSHTEGPRPAPGLAVRGGPGAALGVPDGNWGWPCLGACRSSTGTGKLAPGLGDWHRS